MEKNPLSENKKLVSLGELVKIRDELDAAGGKLALTNGCFDLLHSGHNYFLKNAASLGDRLVVMLNSEESVRALKGPTRPVQNDLERAYNLASLSAVDYVCVFSSKRLNAEIAAVRPHVYAKAGDYTLEKLDAGERAALEKCGAEIVFLPFLEGFSTTSLIAKIAAAAKAGAM